MNEVAEAGDGAASRLQLIPCDAAPIHGAPYGAFRDEVIHTGHGLARGETQLLPVLLIDGTVEQGGEHVHDALRPARQRLAQPFQRPLLTGAQRAQAFVQPLSLIHI